MKKPTKKKSSNTASKFSDMLKRYFNIDYSENDVNNSISNMGISDIVSMDIAIEKNDIETIKDILTRNIQLEYAIPGRTNLSSTAQNRPTTEKPKTSSGTLSPTELQTKNQMDDAQQKKDDELQKEIKDKEEELDTIKRLAGIK